MSDGATATPAGGRLAYGLTHSPLTGGSSKPGGNGRRRGPAQPGGCEPGSKPRLPNVSVSSRPVTGKRKLD